MDCTPRLAQLCFSLAVLSADLTRQVDALTNRLGCPTDECLTPATHNIVDKKKEKQRHLKKWSVTLKEKIDDAIEFEELD